MERPVLPIVTERLVLRPWEDDDVDAMSLAIAESIEHLRPWMPWVADEPLGRAGRLAIIRRFRAEIDTGASIPLGIFRDGEPVGGTGLHPRIGPGGLEIGYWIHVAHTGQGVATEAAGALTEVAFTLDGIDRVVIHHDIANTASGRVPAKLGFTMVGRRTVPAMAPAETGTQLVWVRHRTPVASEQAPGGERATAG